MKFRTFPLLGGLLGAAFALSAWGRDMSESTDSPGPWTTGGTEYGGPPNEGAWIGQTATSLDGVDAAHAQLSAGAADSWMETVIPGPTTLYFSARLGIGGGPYDSFGGGFKLLVNGNTRVLGAPPTYYDWKEWAVALPGVSNTVRWHLSYFRGASGSAYVDQVWTSDDPRPRITDTVTRAGTLGTPFSWEVMVHSAGPCTLSASGLPTGLTVDPASKTISGAPTAAGWFQVTLTAANANGQHVTRALIKIAPVEVPLAEAMDVGFTFTQDAPASSTPWKGVVGLGGHDGVDCAVQEFSADTGTSGSTMSFTVNGPGTLRFWHKGDKSPNIDQVVTRCFVGATAVHDFLGWWDTEVWIQRTLAVPAGPQTVTLQSYRYSGPTPSPDILRVYIDEVSFVPSSVPPQSTYEAWQAAWNVTGQAATADFDGDGLGLLVEYATGGSPYAQDQGKGPTLSVVDGHLTLFLPKAATPTDLLYIVQSSKSLAANSWTSLNVELLEEDENHLLARCKKLVTEEPLCHLRVKVILAP